MIVRANGTDGRTRRSTGNVNAVTAGDHASHRFTGFRIHLQWLILHTLLHFETPDWLRRIGRFVNVDRHL